MNIEDIAMLGSKRGNEVGSLFDSYNVVNEAVMMVKETCVFCDRVLKKNEDEVCGKCKCDSDIEAGDTEEVGY